MRLIFLVLTALVCTRASAQENNMAKLVLRTGACRPMPFQNPTTPDSIMFFRQPDNTLITKVLMRIQRRYPVELSLPKGEYHLIYPNIYGETVDKYGSFYNDSAVEISLCPDSLLTYPDNTLSRLMNKESLSVGFHSIGCFNDNMEKLTITRINGQLEARLYKEGAIHYKRRTNILIGQKKLGEKDIQAFIGFENELRKAHKSGCTTVDHYFIRSKYWNCRIEDGSCSWGGFYTLKICLFGEHLPD